MTPCQLSSSNALDSHSRSCRASQPQLRLWDCRTPGSYRAPRHTIWFGRDRTETATRGAGCLYPGTPRWLRRAVGSTRHATFRSLVTATQASPRLAQPRPTPPRPAPPSPALPIPIIGDCGTGYGNPMNVQRTVRGYAAAGFAGILIEDQAILALLLQLKSFRPRHSLQYL